MKTLQEIIDLLNIYEFESEAGALKYCAEFMEMQTMAKLQSIGSFSSSFTNDRYDLNENYYVVIYGKEFEDRAYDGIAPADIIQTDFDHNKNLGWGIIFKNNKSTSA